MRRGPEYVSIVVAFVKDGVIQMLVLMMIYGTLIPNPPAVAARTMVAMLVGPVAAMLLLRFHPMLPPSSRSSARPRRPARISCSSDWGRRWRRTARCS